MVREGTREHRGGAAAGWWDPVPSPLLTLLCCHLKAGRALAFHWRHVETVHLAQRALFADGETEA
jgi:hypothetical protein